MEDKIVESLRKLYVDLEQQTADERKFAFNDIIQQIIAKLFELIEISQNQQIIESSKNCIKNYRYYLEKEFKFLELAHQKVWKKNAARIRHIEYYKELKNAKLIASAYAPTFINSADTGTHK